MTVRDRDLGLREIQRNMKIFQKGVVVWGFPSENADPELASIAKANEFGTSRIPARPFQRRAVETNRDRIDRKMESLVKSIIDRRVTGRAALDRFGEFMVGLVQEQIDLAPSWARPNAPRTIDKKGHDAPLIDRGKMRDGVKHFVRGTF